MRVISVDDEPGIDLQPYDKVVIGASIRYGRHRPQVLDFIRRNAGTLERKAGALFTVNIVARKPEKSRPDTNPYMKKLLKQIPWRPQQLEVFAGKLDYPRYGFLDRNIIRFIMLLTGGPTNPSAVVEYTDWQRVDAFGRKIAAM